jgi:arylsulfatase A-like enzyme
MIAALVASAVLLLTVGARAQNQSDRIERGNKAEQGARESTNAVLGKMPSVDRLSRSGMIFTDWYSRQSCTSGRAAIVTGRYPVRAGLTKAGQMGTD